MAKTNESEVKNEMSKFSLGDFGLIRLNLQRVRAGLRKTNSRLIEKTIRRALQRRFLKTGTIPHARLRSLVQTLLPIDPLRGEENLPPIDVVIPFVEKDISVLPLCLAGVLRNVRNPISTLTLVTPADQSGEKPRLEARSSREILAGILRENPQINLAFDHQILGEEPLKVLRDSGAKGWEIQQILKFAGVLRSTEIATLIVDADTVLLSAKTWLVAGGPQLLQVAIEFEDRYMGLIAQHFSIKKTLPVSFVTHHQLMQHDVVEDMFPLGMASLLDWWRGCLKNPGSAMSEYEAYGSYISERYTNRAVLGTWSNLSSPGFATFNTHLQTRGFVPEHLIRDYCSVSFHSYLQTV